MAISLTINRTRSARRGALLASFIPGLLASQCLQLYGPATATDRSAAGARNPVLARVSGKSDAPNASIAKSGRHHNVKSVMVPPPPPFIPLMPEASVGRHMSTAGIVLDYLSKSELEQLKLRLEKALAKAKTEKEERVALVKEKAERLDQFEQLFKEGVVSRKELEVTRKELREVEESASDIIARFTDAQVDLDRATKALGLLSEAKNVQSSVSSDKPRPATGKRVTTEKIRVDCKHLAPDSVQQKKLVDQSSAAKDK